MSLSNVSPYEQDRQSLLAAVPDFYELPLDQAIEKLDQAVEAKKVCFKTISFSPAQSWHSVTHIREVDRGIPRPPLTMEPRYFAEKIGSYCGASDPKDWDKLRSLGYQIYCQIGNEKQLIE